MFTVNLAKESFKFSGTHFTIFSADSAERMHGHNYQVSLKIHVKTELDPQLGFAFDFNEVKPLIKKICDELDEYILIPSQSPFLKIEEKANQIEVRFHEKTYSLPGSDVRILPISNVTVEELSRWFARKLVKIWTKPPKGTELTVTVEETAGQSVSFDASWA